MLNCSSWVWLFWDPMDHILPGSSVHGILQARILEWVTTPSSRDLPNPGIQPASPTASAFQSDCLPLSHWGSPINSLATVKSQLPLGDWTGTLWMRISESTDLVNCKQWFLSVVIQLTLTSSFYKLSSSQVCVSVHVCTWASYVCILHRNMQALVPHA